MRVEIVGPSKVRAGEDVKLRVTIFNDSYDPINVFRNALVGPNIKGPTPGGFPRPDSVEASFGQAEEPLTLQPFTFYGRERTFNDLAVGDVEIMAHYAPPDGGDRLSDTKRIVVVEGMPSGKRGTGAS